MQRSIVALVASASLFASSPALAQSVQDLTGLTALKDRLGASAPTGAGVPLGQVEANAGGWTPDTTNPEFAGKTFTFKSPSPAPSGHATYVGQRWYGNTSSLAPGVTTIDCWDANGWLNNGFVNGTTATPPDLVTVKIFNNSWIGGGFGPNKLLRKVDYAVNVQGLIFCNGVNNGAGALDVALLSHMFNGLAVGRSDGQHRSGGTLAAIDQPGRMKPEIVAPEGATSFSTPLVAGGATLLVETARTLPALASNPDAERPDVVRAVLMTGAEHRAGWTNNPATSGPTRGSTATPLDAVFGADELDVDHAHWILAGAEQAPASSAGAATDAPHGAWSLASTTPGSSAWWAFHVESDKPIVSVLAAWNRDVALDFNSWTMPDHDLELWRVASGTGQTTLVGDAGLPYFAGGNVQSVSAVDNLEHLYLTDLVAGDYLLELRRPNDSLGAWNVAVAWEFQCVTPLEYCVGKTTSLGQVPDLSAHGFSNVSANQFELRVKNGVPNKTGVVFWGTQQNNAPFLGGTLCVKLPIVRLPVVTLDANGAVTVPLPLDPTMVGAKRDFQFWFRDPSHPDGTGVGLSDAVEVQFCF
ncbi:MAG: hypothetical protein HZA52_20925 [Planctomycetes bacterium]|nr:hypothetical protein [Planctomycetota bacterium]